MVAFVLTPAHILGALAPHPGYAVLAHDLEQASEFPSLPAIRDPMDRLIVAAARAIRARLVSDVLAGQGVEWLWPDRRGVARRCLPT